jgi:hypothetical protein
MHAFSSSFSGNIDRFLLLLIILPRVRYGYFSMSTNGRFERG